MPKQDQIALQMLSLLIEDSRQKSTAIATQLGISEATVRQRMAKLVKTGVIRRFTIEVDPRRLGYNIVAQVGADIADPTAMLEIISYINELRAEGFGAKIRMPRLFLSQGDHDIMMEIWASDLKTFRTFLKEKLEDCEHFARICPAIVVQGIS